MKRIIPGLLLLIGNFVSGQSVWTQHNDQARTGWYPNETTLNINNVNKNTFGLILDHITDDKIVSQPLVILNVNIPGHGIKNIVVVTTLNNTVYAYDADVNADAYWTINFTNKISKTGPDCNGCRPARTTDIHPSLCGGSYNDLPTPSGTPSNMGIVGTPVVDTTAATIYFVTKIVNPNDGAIDNHSFTGAIDPTSHVKDEYSYGVVGFHQYLHAVDITTGLERSNSPVEITAVQAGTGDTGNGFNPTGFITFNPRTQFNRAGLVLSQGKIYIAFAAHCDNNPSHGWIMSYDAATLTQVAVFDPTPNDGRGGVWMSGTAPAVDDNGNIYFTTGNSLLENDSKHASTLNEYDVNTILPSDPANRGEGVVKLAPDLTLSSYFTPTDYIAFNNADLDLPIQVMLLPNNMAMTGCKDGSLYVMDRTNLGGFNSSTNQVKQTINNGGTMHSTFAYFGGSTPLPFAYQFSEGTQLKAYPVTSTGLGFAINYSGTPNIAPPKGSSGGWLSVSSNGNDQTTGILWAYQALDCDANQNTCPGILHAVNASDLTKNELWNSEQTPVDHLTYFNKFSCPTIALGKVYIPANYNHLLFFGLKTNTTCLTNVALNKTPVIVSTTNNGTANNVDDGDFNSFWVSEKNDNDFVYIDLGARYDICRSAIFWHDHSYGNYGQDFDIRVSDDGTTWTTVSQFRGNTATYSETNNAVTGRYVGMFGIKRPDPTYGYGIWEFQIYGSPASPCATPSGLAASSNSPSSEHLSWNAISGVNYIIQYNYYLEQSAISRTSATGSIDLTQLACASASNTGLYNYTIQADCGTIKSAVASGSFTTASCGASGCDLLPTRYHNLDMGDIGIAGSTCKVGSKWTLTASGADIDGISDQFQFAFTNDGTADDDIIAQITQQSTVNSSNKVGIMIRDSMTVTSRFAYIYSVNNGTQIIFEYRNIAGGLVQSTIAVPFSLNSWVKISKSGTNYSAFISPNGSAPWTQVGTTVNLNFGTTNQPNYGMAVTSTSNSVLSSGTFDNLSITLGSGPLPITLINFTAKKISDNDVLISWTTTMEHLVNHFEIQRSSDNNSFQTIATVATDGESQIARNYSVHDSQPGAGWNYYRLKELDKDGKFYYSPVVAVNISGPREPEISPNPAGVFTNVNAGIDPILGVRLYDATGKMLQNIHSEDGSSNIRLNTADLMKGVYFVAIKTKTAIYRKKLIKD